MHPDFFKTIASALDRGGFDVVLVGGWAVNEHGFHRLTRDIDFAFASARKREILDALGALGYTPFSDSYLVTRLRFREPFMPVIELLWVDVQTHRKMLESAVPMAGAPSMRVVGLRELLAMKLHALNQQNDRREKDLLDILTLMRHNPNAPDRTEFRRLCDGFGPPGAFDEFANKWNL